MKKVFLLCGLIFSILLTNAQVSAPFASVDKIMDKIPERQCKDVDNIASYISENFKTENDKIRAVYYWIASRISYDVAGMYNIDIDETTDDKIKNTLRTRKGICANYALLFKAISNKLGIEAVLIDGYTKQNGAIDSISHAWNAAKINGQWQLFDTTWGAGYVVKRKFVKELKDIYFNTNPAKFITSHMPFDPMWQLLKHTVSNQEFTKEKAVGSKNVFDFESEIINYNQLSETEQLSSASERIEKNGVNNALIKERLIYVKNQIEYLKYNQIVVLYNEGVFDLNAFINFRNHQFQPAVTDEELKKMILAVKEKLVNAQALVTNSGSISRANASNFKSISKGLSDTIKQVEEHEKFVLKYISKSKLFRKTMFSKVSWFGVPLN
jgi:hypothetical protein